MSSYDALAASYDGLMADGVYRRRADYLEKLFQKSRIPVHTVLDLACGTGTIACLLQNVAVDHTVIQQRGHYKPLLHGAQLGNRTEVLKKIIALLGILQLQNRLIQLITFFLFSNYCVKM